MGLIKVCSDGACWNKEGHRHMMGCGVAVFVDNEYDGELSRSYSFVDHEHGSNNVAEWLALVEAAKIVKDLKRAYPTHDLIVCSDSQIITNQYNGTYVMNREIFRRYRNEALEYRSVEKVTWIPREENKEADKLSKEGLQILKQQPNATAPAN